jgi:hypothetical protein
LHDHESYSFPKTFEAEQLIQQYTNLKALFGSEEKVEGKKLKGKKVSGMKVNRK